MYEVRLDRRRGGFLRVARRWAWTLTVLVIAAALVRQMLILDRMLIYFPETGLTTTPADVGLAYEDVFLSASDGTRIHGWHVPGECDATALWFHGNAGSIGHRVENILMMRERLGVGVFIIDYRGYGLSEGRPSEKGLYMDAEAAIDHLVSDRGLDAERDVVLFGRSLGVGVAVEMATRHRVRGVILESGFSSVKGMAKVTHPGVPSFLTLPFIEARYDSESKIGRVRSPVMILHGDRDEIVPFEMAERLYEAASEPKRLFRIRGASHNDTVAVGGEAYFDALRSFIFQR